MSYWKYNEEAYKVARPLISNANTKIRFYSFLIDINKNVNYYIVLIYGIFNGDIQSIIPPRQRFLNCLTGRGGEM